MKLDRELFIKLRMQAYGLGIIAAATDKAVPFAMNDQAMVLLTGLPVGTFARHIMASYDLGLRHGSETIREFAHDR